MNATSAPVEMLVRWHGRVIDHQRLPTDNDPRLPRSQKRLVVVEGPLTVELTRSRLRLAPVSDHADERGAWMGACALFLFGTLATSTVFGAMARGNGGIASHDPAHDDVQAKDRELLQRHTPKVSFSSAPAPAPHISRTPAPHQMPPLAVPSDAGLAHEIEKQPTPTPTLVVTPEPLPANLQTEDPPYEEPKAPVYGDNVIIEEKNGQLVMRNATRADEQKKSGSALLDNQAIMSGSDDIAVDEDNGRIVLRNVDRDPEPNERAHQRINRNRDAAKDRTGHISLETEDGELYLRKDPLAPAPPAPNDGPSYAPPPARSSFADAHPAPLAPGMVHAGGGIGVAGGDRASTASGVGVSVGVGGSGGDMSAASLSAASACPPQWIAAALAPLFALLLLGLVRRGKRASRNTSDNRRRSAAA